MPRKPLTTLVVLKAPRVYEKKHPRYKGKPFVYGYAFLDESKVEIDPRQDNFEYLDTLIHEMLHCFLPELAEMHIQKMSTCIAKQIWHKRYRRLPKNK